ncbi:uncharacterized protein JCM10292_005504 [Rhodotorula paludigena]|uniref:uncharacterized protein n=1 Tax=Rhodotorula paludigena TaxID=86838 RepID=UPI00317B9C54
MPFLSKPAVLFLLLNFLRLLSVVAICLVFSAEIFTIDSDIRGMHEAEKAAASPSTTASTRIVRRSLVPDSPLTPAFHHPGFDSSSPTARPVALPVQTSKGFERVHRALQRRRQLARRERADELAAGLSPRSEEDADERSASVTTTIRRATKTSTSEAGVTATNLPLGAVEAAAEKQCKYIGDSSIPKGAAGALFSTLERIFAATILLLALLSELPPPFPPLSRPAVLLQQLWTSFFPPFGEEYGVGVLGAVQVFVGCQVLSHYTAGWVQVSAWFLFLVGILNFLMGLALGARLKVLRSLSKDSTTPSALRKLRLQREAEHSSSAPSEKDGGGAWAHSHAYEQFDREVGDEARPAAAEQRRSFLPASFARFSLKPSRRAPAPPTTAGAKRAPSRNGPNGIVIGAPLPLGGGAAGKGVSVPPPVYHYGRE